MRYDEVIHCVREDNELCLLQWTVQDSAYVLALSFEAIMQRLH